VKKQPVTVPKNLALSKSVNNGGSNKKRKQSPKQKTPKQKKPDPISI